MKRLILFLAICLLVSCRTSRTIQTPIVVDKTHTESVIKETVDTSNINDSIFIKDSIYIKEKGDTIYCYKTSTEYKYKTKYQYINKIDTLVVRDSIPVIKEIKTQVAVNHLYWWQQSLMWCGGIALLLLSCFIFIKVYKR